MFYVKRRLSHIIVLVFFLINTKDAHAAVIRKGSLKYSTIALGSKNETHVIQQCEDGSEPIRFWRVTTQYDAPLEIYSSPDGQVIGEIPSGWNFGESSQWLPIILKRDATGRWAEIGIPESQGVNFLDAGPSGFRSAPLYRPGWVKSSSLVDAGAHCDKPSAAEIISYIQTPQAILEIEIHQDWLKLSDKLATVRV